MSDHPLDELFAEIESRKGSDPSLSYTAKLLEGGPARAGKKLGEEAVEAVIAALAEGRESFVSECADVVFHLFVLMASKGVAPSDVYAELGKRRGRSGLEEKASRKA